ncbi:receptor L domain protein [Trichuris suis]|nr:receptor L domain protein [Trichuris suis]
MIRERYRPCSVFNRIFSTKFFECKPRNTLTRKCLRRKFLQSGTALADKPTDVQLNSAHRKRINENTSVCSGTENGLNKLEVQEKKIDRLRLMYANCTIVHGNLEITYLNSADLDNTSLATFNFFNGIEEVTGYVLIAHNSIHNFSLPRLRIIWGDKKFRPASGQNIGQFSLLVLNNAFEHLSLPELRGRNAPAFCLPFLSLLFLPTPAMLTCWLQITQLLVNSMFYDSSANLT